MAVRHPGRQVGGRGAFRDGCGSARLRLPMARLRHLLLLTGDPNLAPLLEPLVRQGGGFSLTAAKPGEVENVAGLHPWYATLADGEAALQRCVAAALAAPVLLLGAAEAPPGAAGALRKPVRAAALLAALARLGPAGPAEVALAPGLRLDHAGRWLAGGGARVRLTEKEAAILLHLHQAAPRPVPKEELLGQVWGYAPDVATHTLETHLYRLRRKLGQGLPGAEALVVTGPGGYRLGGGWPAMGRGGAGGSAAPGGADEPGAV